MEGFTDYYARLLSARFGDFQLQDFINEINDSLRNYYFSPVIDEPNSRIKKDFWHSYDIEKLPYYRGFVFAIYMNDIIKKTNPSHSLDDVTHDLFNNLQNQNFTLKKFQKIANKYIANGIEGDILRYIDQGNVIPLGNVNLPIIKTSMGRYYIGFNKDSAVNDKIIKNIDVKSNAYKAGLRDGQKILEYDIPSGQHPDLLITIKTTEGVFQFRPEHYDKKEIYQLKDDLSFNEKAQIVTFFNF